MTCIVGLKTKAGVLMGADSAAVNGWHERYAVESPKVFRVSGDETDALIGYTSTFRFGQLVEHRIQLPRLEAGRISVERWMAVEFADAVREALDGGGHKKTDSGVEAGGTMLVAVHGRLFKLQDDFSFTESRAGYAAVGCGDTYALASLWTSGKLGEKDDERRVKMALESASVHNGGVMPPWTVMTLESGT